METEEKRLQSRKRIIRNAALAFLGIVLLLTFFSKTINNMLLPEVECITPWNGYLSYSIRASGEVRAQYTHKIFAQGSWHMVDVLVKEGDSVAAGDVLAIIDTEDIALDIQRKEYEVQKLQDELAQYQATFSGTDLESCRNQVANAQAAVEDAKAYLDITLALFDEDVKAKIRMAQEARDRAASECEAAYKELQRKKAEAERLEDQYNRTVEEKKLAVTIKEREMWYFRENQSAALSYDQYLIQYNQMLLELKRLENDLDNYIASYEPLDVTVYEKAFNQSLNTVKEASDNLSKVTETYAAESEIRLRLNEAQKRYDDAVKQYEESIRTLEKMEAAAKAEQQVYTQTVNEKKAGIQLATLELEQMKKYMPRDGRITAPTDATVRAVNIQKGQACSPQQMLFELIDDNSMLSVQWMLNPEKAELLGIGDDVTFRIRGEKTGVLKGKVKKKEFASQNGLYIYSSDIPAGSGAIMEGMAAEIYASRTSSEYELIVPTSSISNQGGIDCVFVLKERNGALGQEYYVEAVQVSVIEQDDFNSAVSGAIGAQDKVISMSTKALTDGAQVRLR